ncbi:hypothetical protein [Mucilaginibacter gossypiicola]|uniref:hypothetical protein n=1 Tax=Mucilaginibacter gossypiicola TaxID=551995 RepID=UPI00115FEBD8|nr:hypothetical protein [Mucilaginibacter gossypiicola]
MPLPLLVKKISLFPGFLPASPEISQKSTGGVLTQLPFVLTAVPKADICETDAEFIHNQSTFVRAPRPEVQLLMTGQLAHVGRKIDGIVKYAALNRKHLLLK